jgi:hypothetical protein
MKSSLFASWFGRRFDGVRGPTRPFVPHLGRRSCCTRVNGAAGRLVAPIMADYPMPFEWARRACAAKFHFLFLE